MYRVRTSIDVRRLIRPFDLDLKAVRNSDGRMFETVERGHSLESKVETEAADGEGLLPDGPIWLCLAAWRAC